jgi:hypothetical protein
MAHVGLKQEAPFARVAVLDLAAALVATVAILSITVARVRVILARALDLLRALWMVLVDLLQAVRHVIILDLGHAAASTDTVAMAILSVVLEIGMSSSHSAFKILTKV